MLELNSLLFQTMMVLTIIGGVLGIGLGVAWWNEVISSNVAFGTFVVIAILEIVILFMVGAANGIPPEEVLKVLFWFSRR